MQVFRAQVHESAIKVCVQLGMLARLVCRCVGNRWYCWWGRTVPLWAEKLAKLMRYTAKGEQQPEQYTCDSRALQASMDTLGLSRACAYHMKPCQDIGSHRPTGKVPTW
jgi:hypothetical protein